MLRGLLCDLDGTLLDTEPLYEHAMSRALLEHFQVQYSWETQQRIIGKPEHVGAQLIIDTYNLPIAAAEDLLALRDAILLDLFKHVQPRRGVVQLLERAKQAQLKIAIATSSNRRYLTYKSSNNKELFDLVDAIICGDDPAVLGRGKPAPDIYLEAARAIGVSVGECMVLEDAEAGLRAAKSARVKHVFVSPDKRLDAGLFADADGIVDEWDQLDISKYLN
jgi:pseudouridine-5'-monophosphatase